MSLTSRGSPCCRDCSATCVSRREIHTRADNVVPQESRLGFRSSESVAVDPSGLNADHPPATLDSSAALLSTNLLDVTLSGDQQAHGLNSQSRIHFHALFVSQLARRWQCHGTTMANSFYADIFQSNSNPMDVRAGRRCTKAIGHKHT
ncbi:hypothetical protein F444_00527 [Phytophthora nicotianae P1976]|uniref:Uncharacterized protein n=1 Tax=Phytophthora nicotianae P1976 TaxID=1317066 RepID=A0A081B3Z8_PHYNI|nr:hypothetical protein F444_00527 [Phytophthora nicotianae P1976]